MSCEAIVFESQEINTSLLWNERIIWHLYTVHSAWAQTSADQRHVLTVARAQRKLCFDLWLLTEEEGLSSPTVASSDVINSLQPRCFFFLTCIFPCLVLRIIKESEKFFFFLFLNTSFLRCPWVRHILCLLLTSLMIGKS